MEGIQNGLELAQMTVELTLGAEEIDLVLMVCSLNKISGAGLGLHILLLGID